MTSSPLSPFMCLFCILVSLRLIYLPGFLLFLPFIKALFLPFGAFPSALLLPLFKQSSPCPTPFIVVSDRGRGKGPALIKQAVNLVVQGICKLLLQASSQPHFSEELSQNLPSILSKRWCCHVFVYHFPSGLGLFMASSFHFWGGNVCSSVSPWEESNIQREQG